MDRDRRGGPSHIRYVLIPIAGSFWLCVVVTC